MRREETNRRLKNVLITLYWLGRKSQADPFYPGPVLNLKAFEGLLGIALSKVLEDSCPRWSVRDSGYSESWYPDKEELLALQQASYRREDSVESLDSVGSRTLSVTSDNTLRAGSEGCGSDAEAEQGFRMSDMREMRARGYMPTPLRRKRCEPHEEDNRTSPLIRASPARGVIVHPDPESTPPAVAFLQRVREYGSESDSDGERPEPDLVSDDLASRRFRAPPPAAPFNFAVPIRVRGPRPLPRATPRTPGSWVAVSDASRLYSSTSPPRSSWSSECVSHFDSSGTVSPRSSERETATSVTSATSATSDPKEELFLQALHRHMADYGSSSSSEDEERRASSDPDPVTDDLYARRVGHSLHLTSSNPEAARFLPKHWTPEEDAHVRRIQLGSQRRPWYKKLQGFSRKKSGSEDDDDCDYDLTPWLAGPARPSSAPPKAPPTQSKSLSDIPLGSLPLATPHLYRSSLTFDISAEAAAAGQMRQEHLRRIQGRIKETEAKWQEDLTRWKDRRRSANSDLHKKREEREPSGAYGGEAESSEQEAHSNSVSAATCHSSYTHTLAHTPHLQQQQHEADPDPTPRSRALLSRALAVDLPRTETTSRGRLPPSQPAAQGESLPLGSLPSDLACTPTTLGSSAAMPGLTGSSGGAPSRMPTGTPPYQVTGAPHNSNSTPPPPLGPVPNAMKVHWNSPVSSSLTGTPVARAAGPQYPSGADPDPLEELRGAAPFYRPGTPAAKPLGGGGARMSATLPRGFRRSEASSCLSAGVTPRPFGAKPSRVSLSKLYAKDDSHKSLMSDPKERSLFTSLPAPYGKVATFADLEQPLAPPLQSSPKQERRQEEEGLRGGRTSAPVNLSSSSSASKSTASLPDYSTGPQTAETEVLHSDMRVSLNQRPNSATDFGFQTHWDSTGARITSVQPGTPAELSHLRVGDEILSVTGHSVAHMSYNQWKGSMADALAKGTLFMDLRRHGHTDWGWSGHPSLPFKSHKTLNLTSADSTLVGRPEHYVNVSKELGASATSAGKPLTNGVALNGVGPSQMNGGLHDDAVALKNKGGSESAISDLQVPSISASSSRWSWDPEEERKKHETWQREQERLLQEKYQRDQQRLDDEWRRAQQEVGGDGGNHGDGLRGAEEHRAFEMANGGTPLAFSSQSASSTFVSSNQYVEEEGPVKTREEPVQSAEGSSSKEAGLDVCGGFRTNQWPDGAYVFATLADADRTKSKSTPTLDSIHQQEQRGPVGEWPEEKKLGQQMSQGEFERQQILDEMKKRTPLHRDSSWIRQRSSSSSFAKEPVALGNDPVRRVESLDDLHSSSAYTWPSSAGPNPMRPHSALGSCGGYRGPGRYSMGPPGGGGGGGSSTLPASLSASCLRQGPWARAATPSPTPLMEEASRSPPRMSRPLSGRRMCTRCERPLAKGAAMVIESLGLCFHLACFKCVSCRSELRRPGPGSQVRIRNRQLFCDSCYERVRTRPLPK
ncbi:LIM domain only protein 7 [Clupea harengus]|uniref:LIM domain only protein 7 n=1 Tax=Clupea harengus TaxID=7950 RepID=A0A6P8ER39_CLUHA|nr:LIM domain only protein 7 [Clupea harengus]